MKILNIIISHLKSEFLAIKADLENYILTLTT